MSEDWSAYQSNEQPADLEERLSLLADKLEQAEARVSDLTEQLEQAKEELRQVGERDIPDLLQGVKGTFKLKDGRTIKVSEKVRCGLKGDQKNRAYLYLKNNGYGNILKRQVVVDFDREADEHMPAVLNALRACNAPIHTTEKMDVNHNTLEAFIREKLGDGVPLPEDVFGIYVQKKTSVG